MTAHDLNWAESFWKGISPYVCTREEDGILILPPNRVYKLNPSAAALLDFLSHGGRLTALPRMNEERLSQIQAFFLSLRSAYDGNDQALERIGYDFQFTRLPILAELALTYRCNHACLFCYAACGGFGPESHDPLEMSTAQAKRIIKIFRYQAKVPFFSFTGGESLLRRDLEGLIAYARRVGLRCNLISNGSLIDNARAASLKRAGLDSAQISLEADQAGLHDRLNAKPGAFDACLAGIRALQDAGISVQTNTTINALNSERLVHMPRFLQELGIRRFSMNLFIPCGRGQSLANELVVPYSQVGPMVDSVHRLSRQLGLEFFWYSPTPFCHYNPIARGLGNKSCAAMDGLLSVNPRGQVIPCSSWDEPMGDLLRDDFKDIWFSQRAAFIKAKRSAPEGCADCSAFVACQGACPLYWKAIGCAELEGRKMHHGA